MNILKAIALLLALGVTMSAASIPAAAAASDQKAQSGNPQQSGQAADPQERQPAAEATERRAQNQDPPPPDAETRQEAEETVQAAARIFTEMHADVQKPIPSAVVQGAAGIAIFPEVIRAGLIAGGRDGTGVLVSRQEGRWSAPVFISIGGASVGAQIGVEASDLVLVFRTVAAINRILEGDDFRLGVDASISAGDSGARAQMTTQDAEIWAYQRNRGLFAGIAVSGAILTLNDERLHAYYDFQDQDPDARGYYPNEGGLARDLLGLGSNESKAAQKIPESAETLRRALQQAAEGQ
jgi:lipid-binding SYLF domain-containing protein